MNSLNSILIEGNLPEDPTIETLESGAKVCRFRVRFERFFTSGTERKQETGHVQIETWNRTAELCVKTLSKGRGVRVVGRIKDVGDDKIIVVGETVEFKTKFDKKPSDM